jgi:hypothetical protein
MYAAYADAIRVPAMWPAIERRIRAQRRQGWVGVALAAAAAIAIVVALQSLMPRRHSAAPQAPAYATAAARYRVAIAQAGAASPAARTDMALLTTAIAESERSAAAASDDPIAVARMVSAYDAKLQLLRSSHE